MNREYWNKYYTKKKAPTNPSLFAEYCLSEYLTERKTIVDLGCGNGRDSFYFASLGHKVFAIDQTDYVETLDKEAFKINDYHKNVTFIEDDFVTINYKALGAISAFYSRWTLHSISSDQEKIVLANVSDSLDRNGLFFIEARTIKDALYGVGEEIEKNVFVTDHYRRFIDCEEFLSEIENYGFEILHFTESSGYSVYKGDDPVLMRTVLRKI